MMANYAVGDIQGCFEEFKEGLELINFKSSKDFLWITGDLINRGPDSFKVLEYVFKIKNSVHIVLGNHDLHYLNCFFNNRSLSDEDTFQSQMFHKKSLKMAKFLLQQPFVFSKKILTKRKAPTFKKISTMSIKDLYNSSPLGTVGALLLGTVHSAVFLFFAVYAAEMNFSILEISIVTFLLTISGAIAQYPIGYISDKFDRRKVIVFTTFGAAFFALLLIFSSGTMYLPQGLGSSKIWFYFFVVLFSFCSLPLFSLILAHTNDYITKDKFVAAGASLQFAFGFGAMSGPFLCSIFMNLIGNNGFFIFIIIFHSMIGFFGIHRMKVRPSLDNPDSQFVPMPQTITPVGMELNPSTEHIDEPYSEKVEKMLKRKGVIIKKKVEENTKEDELNLIQK